MILYTMFGLNTGMPSCHVLGEAQDIFGVVGCVVDRVARLCGRDCWHGVYVLFGEG